MKRWTLSFLIKFIARAGSGHSELYTTTISVSVNKPFAVATGSTLLPCSVAGAGTLAGVIRHHSDDVQQTSEQLQGEVEHPNPEA